MATELRNAHAQTANAQTAHAQTAHAQSTQAPKRKAIIAKSWFGGQTVHRQDAKAPTKNGDPVTEIRYATIGQPRC